MTSFHEDEPHLAVSDGIEITPARLSDVDDWVRLTDSAHAVLVSPLCATRYQLIPQYELHNTPLSLATSWRTPVPYPRELAQTSVEKLVAQSAPIVERLRGSKGELVDACPFDVIRETASGRLIGTINLTLSTHALPLPASFKPDPSHPWIEQTWDVGYTIHPDFSGKGVATRALAALLAWAKADMGLQFVGAGSRASNAASHAVLRKNGFIPAFRYSRTTIRGDTFEAAKFRCDFK